MTKAAASKLPSFSADEFLALEDPKGDLELVIDKTRVPITHVDRIYWPKEKLTKFDLLCYYIRIRDYIMPFLVDRPAILQRYPQGIGKPKFFQHNLESAPRFVKRKQMTNEEGRELEYAVYTTIGGLLYLANLGTIEQHPWNSTVRHLTKPDWIVIDLDPGKTNWSDVLEVALAAKSACENRGVVPFVKTSGSSGIHIYIPLEPRYSYRRAAKCAHDLANDITEAVPKLATTNRSIADRGKRQIYVDWLQNARGKSVAAPFTIRAKPGAPVSMPLTWKQIEEGVKISDFTLANASDWLAGHDNPWANFFDSRATLPTT